MKLWKHILGNQNEKEIVCYEASGMAFQTIFEIFLFKRRFGIQREKRKKKNLWEWEYEIAYLKGLTGGGGAGFWCFFFYKQRKRIFICWDGIGILENECGQFGRKKKEERKKCCSLISIDDVDWGLDCVIDCGGSKSTCIINHYLYCFRLINNSPIMSEHTYSE